MPRIVQGAGSDAGSDDGDVFEDSNAHADAEVKDQITGELQDEVDKTTGDVAHDDDVIEERLAPKDGEDGGEDGEDDDNDDDDDDEEGEEEYSVEAILDHKPFKGEIRYEIKWQGYPEDQNTWEPEDHLLPHAAKLLSAYHDKIGGRPDPALKKSKSKQSLRRQASTSESPAPKRQRRSNGAASLSSEEVGTWLPLKEDWEPLVVKVETIERGDSGQLMAFVLFKNGKRSRVSMEKVYRHCPRPMLRFYEEHLKFK